MKKILNNKFWTKWKSFPDPRKQEYIFAPFGYGIYQLFNKVNSKYILFGKGKNLAYRMTSLLPEPLGQGRRNNNNKKDYVLENIVNIQYRTRSFKNKTEMKNFEDELKKLRIHIFNT